MTTSMLPESAPFNEEQKAWLNGFFAGLIGMQPNADVRSAVDAGGVSGVAPARESPEPEDEEFPWHDAALPIVDRMELAKGKPMERRLMAAMAQLDCGSCGYVCQTYSEAIASGVESNLTLCSPGGQETKQMIKKVLADREAGSIATTSDASINRHVDGQQNGRSTVYSRQNPFEAKLIESQPLNKEGSDKDTRHVVIDLSGSGLDYCVGDALGIYPSNCKQLVAEVIQRLGSDAAIKVRTPLRNDLPLSDALAQDCCLKDPSDELLELLVDRVDGQAKVSLMKMIDEGIPDGYDVLDILELADGATITATDFVETLGPLNPRLYSIASSMKRVGEQVHLTVGKVVYKREGRERKGVASSMLADRLHPGETVRVFVQPNHAGFTTPTDPQIPMIMVGPGTGIAPFIAFLQERAETKATGPNWLFFGDQHEEFDFLYEDELRTYQRSGLLTYLDCAFSRDGDAKVYVQDRMRQRAAEIWEWLRSGACFYVCGDASRMAKDVDFALKEIAAEQGSMSYEQAEAFIKQLVEDGRYHRDVY